MNNECAVRAGRIKQMRIRANNTSPEQFEAYLNLMYHHVELRQNTGLPDRMRQLWSKVTRVLNAQTGPKKDALEWKQIARSWKVQCVSSARTWQKHGHKAKPLTSLQKRAMNLWDYLGYGEDEELSLLNRRYAEKSGGRDGGIIAGGSSNRKHQPTEDAAEDSPGNANEIIMDKDVELVLIGESQKVELEPEFEIQSDCERSQIGIANGEPVPQQTRATKKQTTSVSLNTSRPIPEDADESLATSRPKNSYKVFIDYVADQFENLPPTKQKRLKLLIQKAIIQVEEETDLHKETLVTDPLNYD